MEALKRIGELGKQHYEKILLTLALVGLGVAVAVLYTEGQSADSERRLPVIKKKLAPLEMSANEEARKMLASPPPLNFSSPHNLLNPVKWQRKQDGGLLKIETGEEVGVAQVKVTNITPLYYSIEVQRIPSENSAVLVVTDEAAEHPLVRRPRRVYVATDRPSDISILREVKGDKEDPELILEIVATQEAVSVKKDAPYRQVEGYTADLVYQIDGRTFKGRREGDEIGFGGESYKIVAINRDEVVLSAVLNNRKHTIKYAGG